MVLLRSDGTPTYMLAVVVDDHDMGITHVIRGDDHLTNAARQTQIYNPLGWDVPTFAHIPLIHGPDGAKLSKRHGALGVDAYRAMGYLPDAMRNYLARLGWGHGDEEIFTTAQAADWFDLDAIGRSPSRFDFAKLENLNGVYIRNMQDAELVRYIRQVLPTLDGADQFRARATDDTWKKLEQLMPGLKERSKTIKELVVPADYLLPNRGRVDVKEDDTLPVSYERTLSATVRLSARFELELDEKAAKILSPEARKHLAALKERFAALETWDAASIEAATRTYAEETGAKLGNIAQPLRAAATGRTVSPPVFDVLAVLGRDEALARIADQAA
jgi:glutamyl-tRNA synthetase